MSLKDFFSTKKIIFIVIPILIILIAGGLFGYLKFFSIDNGKQKTSTAEKIEKNKKEMDLMPKPIVPLKPFVVNLLGEAGTRYLKIDIQLEIDNPETENHITQKNPIIRDSVLLLLSSKAYKDINTATGKTVLRNEITQRINAVLTKGKVLQTYFSEFVIQ